MRPGSRPASAKGWNDSSRSGPQPRSARAKPDDGTRFPFNSQGVRSAHAGPDQNAGLASSARPAGGGPLRLRHLTPPPPVRGAYRRRVGDGRDVSKLPGVVRSTNPRSREPEGPLAQPAVTVDRRVVAVGGPLGPHAPGMLGILERLVEGQQRRAFAVG